MHRADSNKTLCEFTGWLCESTADSDYYHAWKPGSEFKIISK